jgi:hypothetical protein
LGRRNPGGLDDTRNLAKGSGMYFRGGDGASDFYTFEITN